MTARIFAMIRTLYTIAGTIALALGILGIFLPLLPATPFLLLAAFCYVRGSARMHAWLMSHRTLGPYIRDFQSGRGIPLRSKWIALGLAWLSLALSAWVVPLPWVRWLLLVPAVGLPIYLWRVPTRRPDEGAAGGELLRSSPGDGCLRERPRVDEQRDCSAHEE